MRRYQQREPRDRERKNERGGQVIREEMERLARQGAATRTSSSGACWIGRCERAREEKKKKKKKMRRKKKKGSAARFGSACHGACGCVGVGSEAPR